MKVIWIIIAAIGVQSVSGQLVLTFDEVVQITLANNFDIRISENQSQIASNNNTLGNAGFLPTINAGADANRASRDSRLVFFSGQEVQADGARSEALNAFVQLDWTVFDGFKMFTTKAKLADLQALGALELRYQMEQVVVQLASLYYRLIQEERLLKVYQNTAALTQQQLDVVTRAYELGGRSELELLNAKVAHNTDKARVLEQNLLIRNLKADLNQLMALAPDYDFQVQENIELQPQPPLIDLNNLLEAENVALKAARVRKQVSRREIEEIRASFYPTVGVFTDFTYNRQANEVGVLESNLTRGTNFGVSVRWNLFNGLNDRREIQNRKLIFENAQLESDKVLAESQTVVFQKYNEYEFARQLLELETENFKNAQQNSLVAQRSFNLGAINDLDLRTIQLTALEAASRQLRAEYLTKIAEVHLMQLTGRLF